MIEAIRRFLDSDGRDGDFESLALALYRWQVARSPLYAAMAEGAEPTCAAEIPAVPVALFKQLAFTTFPLEDAATTFRTSGTTGSARGVVHLRDTALYDLGCARHAHACIAALPTSTLSLCPDDPDSSLGHMVRLLGGAVTPLFGPGGVAGDAWARLGATSAPVWVPTTAFALDALFATDGVASLDPRSVVMVTGGFKGRRARLDAPELYAAIGARLGAPRVVGEYGMTELSSQLWTDPVPAGAVPGAFVAPPWMRVVAVDPITARPADGEGLLRFIDLANVHTVLAIETMDLGRVTRRPDGRDAVELRGRVEGAEARGCSLRAEEFLSASRRPGV